MEREQLRKGKRFKSLIWLVRFHQPPFDGEILILDGESASLMVKYPAFNLHFLRTFFLGSHATLDLPPAVAAAFNAPTPGPVARCLMGKTWKIAAKWRFNGLG